jgi:hypothetical protein
MAWVFSTGSLEYDGHPVGTLNSVDLDQSSTLIPLQGNMVAPIMNATGPGKLSGSCKFSAFDPTFIGTIVGTTLMAPKGADLALIWYLTNTAGADLSLEMPNVTISSLKLSAASDKWLETSMGFEAGCAAGTGALLTVGTTTDPHTAITSAWTFSSGEVTLQTHTVGTINSWDLDISWATIPLMSNYRYPVAVANGAIKVSGSVKFSAFDSNFIETIAANPVMTTPASALTAVLHFHDTAAAAHTITLPNVTLSGWKATAGVDKWFETTVNFEAAADPVTPFNLITIT